MTNQPDPIRRGGVGAPDGPNAPASNAERDITTTAKDVAGSAKDEAAAVAQDAKQQARNLAREAREQANITGTEQRDKAVDTLRSLSDQLDRMARAGTTPDAGIASDGTTQNLSDGTAHEIVRQAAQRTRDLSDYLEQREPGELLDELRRFGRERPALFLGLAAGAGVLAGRLTRSAAAELGDDGDQFDGSSSTPRIVDPVIETRGVMPATSTGQALDPLTDPYAVQPGSVQR
jgi:hypothetical protein